MCDTEAGVHFIRKWDEKYSVGMDEILPRLYVGSLRDAMSREQLERHQIEAVVSVYDFGRDELGIPGIKRMRLKLADSSAENVREHFSAVNSFIHHARLENQNVLVHCLAGASRSVCFVVAYVMSITNLDYPAALAFVSHKRICAEPNFGFRMQLHKFGLKEVLHERERLKQEFGQAEFDALLFKDCHHSNSLYLKHDSIADTKVILNGLSSELTIVQDDEKNDLVSEDMVFIDE